jgi:mRNA-degrading endonuclease RelE of RelBE toxin-antitoxin system
MTPQEQAQKIKEITDRALAELKALGDERHEIIRSYVKELEAKKIDTIRAHILEV